MSYRTEQEQIEIFAKWWKENGRLTLIVVILALGLYVAWSQWQAYKHRRAEAASALYQELLESEGASSASTTESLIRLKEEYGDTFYGQASLLFLARQAAEKGELEAAESHLDHLIRQNPGDDLAYTARLRSARILHALGRDEEALSRLQEPVTSGFKRLFAELRGDIYLAQNKPDKARVAYEEAIKDAEAKGVAEKEILEMKLSQANAAP